MKKKLHITSYLQAYGLDKQDLVEGAKMSWTTVGKLLSGKTVRNSTLERVAEVISAKAGKTIRITDLYIDPFAEPQAATVEPPSRASPDNCIDVDDLPELLVNKDGEPLTANQQKLLRQYIATLLGR